MSSTATVCLSPAAATVTLTCRSASTIFGANRVLRSPCPSCPYKPLPHVYTRPSRLTATQCVLDALTWTTSTPSSAAIGVGTGTRYASAPAGWNPAPCPSWPTSPHPKEYATPPLGFAAARRDHTAEGGRSLFASARHSSVAVHCASAGSVWGECAGLASGTPETARVKCAAAATRENVTGSRS